MTSRGATVRASQRLKWAGVFSGTGTETETGTGTGSGTGTETETGTGTGWTRYSLPRRKQ